MAAPRGWASGCARRVARAGWLGAVAAALAAGCSDGRSAPRGFPPRPLDPGAGAPVDAGAAGCEDGEVVPCHVALGEHAGVVSCFVGSAVCRGGTLGPCVDGAVSTREAPAGALLLAGSLPGSCASNPCDPYCFSLLAPPDGGLSPSSAEAGSYVGGSLSSIPAGLKNKGLKDAAHPPKFSPCSAPEDCQFDTHCVAGVCVAWAPGEVDPACDGVDLTAGPACGDVVPVCNRGKLAAPAGIALVVLTGNSSQLQNDLGVCARPGGTVVGGCQTTAPIPPGGCVDVLGCPLGGTSTIMVNPPSLPPATPQVTECHCENDWSVYHPQSECVTIGAPLEATTVTQSYQPVCPPGSHVQWGYLAFEAVAPSDASGASSLTIHAVTSSGSAPLATVEDGAALLADVPSATPGSCAMGGPAPCPTDVFEAVGGLPNAMDEKLTLVFRLTPTPSGLAGPVVSSWQLTYSCRPIE